MIRSFARKTAKRGGGRGFAFARPEDPKGKTGKSGRPRARKDPPIYDDPHRNTAIAPMVVRGNSANTSYGRTYCKASGMLSTGTVLY